MSQHHLRTKNGPSGMSIGLLVGFTMVILVTVGWVASGPVSSELIGGVVLGSLLFIALSCQVAGRLIERRIVLDRHRRELDAERAVQEAEYQRRMQRTGTWEGSVGQMLVVRYADDSARWYVHGWLGEFWQLSEETEWGWHIDSLISAITELEATGELAPCRDEGTAWVRRRFGWADGLSEPELDLDVAGLDHWASGGEVPSPAALARLSMPVPRDEAERAQWRLNEGRTKDLSEWRQRRS